VDAILGSLDPLLLARNLKHSPDNHLCSSAGPAVGVEDGLPLWREFRLRNRTPNEFPRVHRFRPTVRPRAPSLSMSPSG
jgi:hypothetical protein